MPSSRESSGLSFFSSQEVRGRRGVGAYFVASLRAEAEGRGARGGCDIVCAFLAMSV